MKNIYNLRSRNVNEESEQEDLSMSSDTREFDLIIVNDHDSQEDESRSEGEDSEDVLNGEDSEDALHRDNIDIESGESGDVLSGEESVDDVGDSCEENSEFDAGFVVGDYKAAYQELYDGWDEGLTPDEIKEYTELIEQAKTKYTGFTNVLKANLLDKDKELAIEHVAVINQMLKDEHINLDFFEIQNKLLKSIKTHDKYTMDQLKNYKVIEEHLIEKMDQTQLRFKILDLQIPDGQKMAILKRFNNLQGICRNSDEYAKLKSWIDTALSLPWNKSTPLPVTYDSTPQEKAKFVQETLIKWNEKQGYVQAAKEEMILNILDTISIKKVKGSAAMRPKVLTLRGSPGVGKTLFLQSLAEILKIPIYWIDFSGATDPSMIRGFEYTYTGSQPGRIVKGAIEMQSMNGIIVLEEIDKIVQGGGKQNKVENTLVSLLDRTRSDWIDDYLEFPMDISNYMFVATINDEKLLTDPLRNRLHMIEFPAYDIKQKIHLSKQFEIPKSIKVRGINPDDIIISDHIIQYISNKMTKDDGMRNLKRAIDSIVQRANFYFQLGKGANDIDVKFGIKDFKIPFILNEKHVDIFLEHLKSTDKDWQKMFL
jgi:ATP-dependent Lon protease